MEQDRNRSTIYKLIIIWLGIILLGSFWLTVRGASEPLHMSVITQAPKLGDSVLMSFKINNPSSEETTSKYSFYADGKLLKEGAASIPPNSSKTYKYAYENPLELGEQINFLVKMESDIGNYEKSIALPAYPPQILTSFVSFASFSTSVMSSMSSIVYYQSTFGTDIGLNIGVVISAVLLSLLIFLELAQPAVQRGNFAILRRLKFRFSPVSWILLIIFIGIIYTKVILILST